MITERDSNKRQTPFRSPIKKKSMRNVTDREEEAYNILKQATQRDACSTFGEHVANEIRNLNTRTQLIVKHKINTLLFEAAMGYHDDETFHTQSSILSRSCTPSYSSAPSPSPLLPSFTTSTPHLIDTGTTSSSSSVHTVLHGQVETISDEQFEISNYIVLK